MIQKSTFLRKTSAIGYLGIIGSCRSESQPFRTKDEACIFHWKPNLESTEPSLPLGLRYTPSSIKVALEKNNA